MEPGHGWRARIGTARTGPMLAAIAVLVALASLVPGAANAAEQSPGEARESKPRIIGGYYPGTGQWPWMASIQVVNRGRNAHERHYCGGALIHPKLVVTAAHCVTYENTNRAKFWPKQLRVVLGRHDLLGGGGEVRRVSYYEIHPRYTYPTSLAHDLALIYLKRRSYQEVAPLLDPGVTTYDGTSVTTMGWGATVGGAVPSAYERHLRAIDLLVWTDETCVNWVGNTAESRAMYYSFLHFPSMICAARDPNSPEATCNGDSGSPMMLLHQGRWRLLGLTSWGGIGCPGYYDVSVFTWLQNTSMRKMIRRGMGEAWSASVSPSQSGNPVRTRPTDNARKAKT